MGIGFGQLIILIILGILLFGNLPKFTSHLSKSIRIFQDNLKKSNETDKDDKKLSISSKEDVKYKSK